MEKIKLVIFDLDGTLIDAYQAIEKSLNFVLRHFGLAAQDGQKIRQAVGWGDLNLLKPFLKKDQLAEGICLYRKDHQASLKKYARLYPQVRILLEYLKKKGYRLAVASNRPTKFSLIILRVLKIKDYFDYLLCADKLKFGKPHPLILNTIRKKFRVSADQALYVGDMVIDLLAGKRAGMRTIIVTTGSSNKKEIAASQPYLIIKSIKDLRKIL